jgi:hypothetical protein
MGFFWEMILLPMHCSVAFENEFYFPIKPKKGAVPLSKR